MNGAITMKRVLHHVDRETNLLKFFRLLKNFGLKMTLQNVGLKIISYITGGRLDGYSSFVDSFLENKYGYIADDIKAHQQYGGVD